MEYGEAINAEASGHALKLARQLKLIRPELPLDQIAREAVGHAYCACVTDGEDAAEHRFSDVHRRLIEDLASTLRGQSASASGLHSDSERLPRAPTASQGPERIDR